MYMNKLNINIDEFINNTYAEKCKGFRYIPAIYPPDKNTIIKRIIVMGDIHGDYKLFKDLLKIAGLIGTNSVGQIIWTGGQTHVVQVGDQIDRCRPVGNMTCANPLTTVDDEASDVKIMTLANELDRQASIVGGAFISLLGNHEILNSTGSMNYVSYMGFKEFENYTDPKNPSLKFKDGFSARKHAFAPGNEIGTMLGCTRLPAVIINSHLFVHAGIIDGLIEQLGLTHLNDLETINVAVRMWLLGILKKRHVKYIIKASKVSMFWTRILGNIPPGVSLKNPACIGHIGKVLNLFKIGSIIVGHTPQSFTYSDDINQTCDGKVWRVDNGSAKAFNNFDRTFLTTGKTSHARRPQVLEIIDGSKYFILDGMYRKKVNI